MEIKICNRELTKGELYQLTRGADRLALGTFPGDVITINTLIVYEESAGTCCAIKTNDGEIYVTNSKPFIEEITTIYGIFGEELTEVKLLHKTAKSGRQYTICTVA